VGGGSRSGRNGSPLKKERRDRLKESKERGKKAVFFSQSRGGEISLSAIKGCRDETRCDESDAFLESRVILDSKKVGRSSRDRRKRTQGGVFSYLLVGDLVGIQKRGGERSLYKDRTIFKGPRCHGLILKKAN